MAGSPLAPREPAPQAIDRAAEAAINAKAAQRYHQRVETLADRALAAASSVRTRAKTVAAATAPVAVALTQTDAKHIVFALLHTDRRAGVNAFCQAVTSAIDARLERLGSSERATVTFNNAHQRALSVSIGVPPTPAQRAQQVIDELVAIVVAADEAKLAELRARAKPQEQTIRACFKVVLDAHSDESFARAFKHDKLTVIAFFKGEQNIAPEPSTRLMRDILTAVRDRPDSASGVGSEEINAALQWVNDIRLHVLRA